MSRSYIRTSNFAGTVGVAVDSFPKTYVTFTSDFWSWKVSSLL